MTDLKNPPIEVQLRAMCHTLRTTSMPVADIVPMLQRAADHIDSLKGDLHFVERWANHHGTKPNMTAEQALSVIQHFPVIHAITRSYADGKIPDTFDPYARIAELEAQLTPAPWLHYDNADAIAEGWAMFNEDTNPTIQVDDEAGILTCDADAWRHVWARAASGSALHKKALAYILEHNMPHFAEVSASNASPTYVDASKVSIDAAALREILVALNGPGHLIRELQVTRGLRELIGEGEANPIDAVLRQYNDQATPQPLPAS